MAKFMLSLRDENFRHLVTESEERGISIQELIRAVIIPDWVKQSSIVKATATSAFAHTRSIIPNNGKEQLVEPIGRVRRLATPFNP